MKVKLLWITILIFTGMIFLGVSGYFTALWWVGNYLETKPKFGEIQIEVQNVDLTWNLKLDLDGVVVHSPSANIYIDSLETKIHLFSGFFHFNPSLMTHLGQVTVVLKKSNESAGMPDSLLFPDFEIPLPLSLTAKSLQVKDSLPLFTMYFLQMENPESQIVTAKIKSIKYAETQAVPGLEFKFDWSEDNWVRLSVHSGLQQDTFHLIASHSKANLFHGNDSIHISIQSSRTYESQWGLPPSFPEFKSFRLTAMFSLDSLIRCQLNLNSEVLASSDSLPFDLSPQSLSLFLDFDGNRGDFILKSHGKESEDINILAEGRVKGGAELHSLERLVSRISVKAEGYIHGLPVKILGKRKIASLILHQFYWDQHVMRLNLSTGDSSTLQASLIKRENSDVFSGNFAAEVQRDERWIEPFLDSSITFKRLSIKGDFDGTNMTATSRVGKVRAYGVTGDSLIAWHNISKHGYKLDSSKLIVEDTYWVLAGFVDFSEKLNLRFTASHSQYGNALFSMTSPNVMHVEAKNLSSWKVPYAMADSVMDYKPIITGQFSWDQKKKTGQIDARVSSTYGEKNVKTVLQGQWSPDTLDVKHFSLRIGNSMFQAKARTAMKGAQFYDFSQWTPKQFITGEIKSDNFNVGDILPLFMEDPPLRHAKLQGDLYYADSMGFKGRYTLSDVLMNKYSDKFSIKKFEIVGSGESLIFEIVTDAKDSPFFKDSLLLQVSGLLKKQQDIDLRLTVGDDLEINFNGKMHPSKNITGLLNLTGKLDLPGEAGRLDSLSWKAEVSLPFKNTLDSMVLISDYLHGQYHITDIEPQTFSAHPGIKNGIFKISDLTIETSGSDPLTGRLMYPLDGVTDPKFRLQGPFMAFQYRGNTVKFTDMDIKGSRSANSLRIDANLQKIEGTYNDFPLKVKGVLVNTGISAIIPQTNNDVGSHEVEKSMPSVTVNSTLKNSLIQYRLNSLRALQELFKRGTRSKTSHKPTVGSLPPFILNATLKTSSTDNRVDTDILQLNYVADLKIAGTFPYTLWSGRINGTDGQFGLEGQAYQIKSAEAKWLNEELSQGELNIRSTKQLAVDCQPDTQDSCGVTTTLQGKFEELQFNYTSNCLGLEGEGANITALVLSVKRGCYDAALFNGQGGYAAGAASLLEPAISGKLSDWANDWTRDWIARVNVSGMQTLVPADDAQNTSETTALTTQPAALEIITKEYRRVRLKAKGGVLLNEQELDQPYALHGALQYRPPLAFLTLNKEWKHRLRNNVALEATLEVDPVEKSFSGETLLQKKLELSYEQGFWNLFGIKK